MEVIRSSGLREAADRAWSRQDEDTKRNGMIERRTGNAGGKRILRGYTFLEVMISVSLFLIMTAAVSASFTSGFSAYRDARAIQKNLETAQFAVNTLAKSLRTSSIVRTSAPLGTANFYRGIIFYDYSQDRCFEYAIDTNSHQLKARWASKAAIASADSSLDPLVDCGAYTFSGAFAPLTSEYVDGVFYVISSVPSGTKKFGRVVISLTVKKDATSGSRATVQTSVSLRDYNYVKL